MQKVFDTIILGLGATGSAALYQLSKRSKNILGMDQFSPPHNLGSSHGESRIIRQATGEGAEYIPLVLRSYEIWDEIEREIGKKLLYVTGGLILESRNSQVITHGRLNYLQQTVNAAKQYNLKYEMLDTHEIKKRFPQFNVTNEAGYFDPKAGYLLPELCIEAQLGLAKKNGVQIHKNEKVLNIIPSESNNKVTIQTDRGKYEAGKIIICAGPWINQFLDPEYTNLFTIYRQVLFWFKIDQEHIQNYVPNNFPIYIWVFEKGNEFGFYGLPSIDGQTIKMAGEQFTVSTTPDEVKREVTENEKKGVFERFVKNRLIGITDECTNAESCLYTTTPDSGFVIDFHQKHPQIIVASPCSGYGFKHSAAIGEVIADLTVDGKSKQDISKFSFSRFIS